MRALDFGDIDQLKAKYGSVLVNEVPAIGGAEITSPNILIKGIKAAPEDDYQEIIL